MYLFSFALASLFCVGFSFGAKADSVSKWTATWNLSNHQTVDVSIAPGTSVFRGWTLNINGPMKKGQVYYIRNSPALLGNSQNEGFSSSVHEVFANFEGFFWWVEGDRFFYYADKDADWVRVYVSYNMYNVSKQTWLLNNAPSSYTDPINLSDIPPNLDADHAQDILTALNNINSSVNTADQEARKRLEAINNSINNNYNDLTRPSDSAVDSASGTLSDTSDVKAATGLFTSIDNLTQGVFNLFANPYMKGIDLLNPYGTIYTYSPTFELISKRDINAEFFLDASMPLNSDDYIFTIPAIWTNQEAYFINLETQNLDITNYSGTISSGNTMDKECFYKIGNNFYFVPRGINYYFYRIDDKKKVLIPIMYLDFGDSEIREGDLPGCAVGENTGTNRTKSDNKRDKLLKGMQERAQFIRDECLVAPLVKFFNDDYVYIFFTRGVQGYGGHYIYNRKNGEGFLLNEGKPFVMQPCFGIEGNVLMAITDAYYLPTVVDTSLMSAQEIHKMGQLKEEDNPVILKYYLRK